MKYYYIGYDKILVFDELLDVNLYNYKMLNDLQVKFYLSHPDATIDEILNCCLVYNKDSFDILKHTKVLELQANMDNLLHSLIPQDKLNNVILGFIYTEQENNNIKKTIELFHKEYDEKINLINDCEDIDELNNITYNFPDCIVESDFDYDKSFNVVRQFNLDIDGSNSYFFEIFLSGNSSFSFKNMKCGIFYNFLIYNNSSVAITIPLPTFDYKVSSSIDLDIDNIILLKLFKTNGGINIWEESNISKRF